MLPDGWRNIEFGKLFDIKSGVGFKYSEYRDKGIPLIKIDNIGYGHIKWENKSYLPIEYANEYPDLLLNEGDILLALNRPITQNKLKIARVCKNDIPSMLYQRVGKIYGKSNLSFSDFFYYVFNELIFDFVKNKSIGSDQPFISTNELKTIKLPLPPLPEQKKIAAILSTWDRAIEGTEKLLANSQQQKKALMQQLLTGKKRLPGFTGEWKICTLSDVATVQTATSKTQYICENGERFIVDMGSVNRLGNLVCTKSTQHNADLLPKGTLVMPKDDIGGGNIIGRTSYIDRDDLYVLGDHVYALHIGDCDSKFLHFLINSYPINKNLRRRANGTAQLGLGKKDVLRQKIKIPSEFPEQQAIAAVLSTADEEITAIESNLSRLRQEKKALMQQLLTGKRRVKVD